MKRSLVFISETMPLGGTSTFVLNICSGLSESETWRATAATMRSLGDVGRQVQEAGFSFIQPDQRAVIHEERAEHLFEQIAPLRPSAVVACLSAGAFDFLRYVPEGVVRIGMIQSDETTVYELVERYLPWLDVVVGVSAEICRKISAIMMERKVPVYQQAYGVPMSSEFEIRSRGPRLKVIYIGRVEEEQKRASVMARVIRSSIERSSGIEWTIAGEGPELGFLKDALDGLDRIEFLGAVRYSEVPTLLKLHDAYFLCSDYEGLPLSLLEAMGLGVVPVVSDLPSGISEVVNDSNGYRIQIQDETGYVDALLDLASDPAKLERFSINAAQSVRNSHSVEAMTERWVKMLNEQTSENTPNWPPSCVAERPIGSDDDWYFHSFFRPIRAWLTRLVR
jgi:glycosyltransferase involved in cell wall biosynthesis